MKAVTDEESDAMQMLFPVLRPRHAQDRFLLRRRSAPTRTAGRVACSVPAERRINETLLEVRYSPTLAGAMVDALPYLVDYPYGCTEQTLNRFLPTVITQRMLQRHEAGPEGHRRRSGPTSTPGDRRRPGAGQGLEALPTRNPVFDEDEVAQHGAAGVQALAEMQLPTAAGAGSPASANTPWPHTTAVVVHGLQIAKQNDVAAAAGHARTRRRLAARTTRPSRSSSLEQRPGQGRARGRQHADNLDALVYMVLVDGGVDEQRDARLPLSRPHELAVYAKAMFGLALHKERQRRQAGDDPQEHRAVRRAGRGEPDGVSASCRPTMRGGTGTAARSRPTPTI